MSLLLKSKGSATIQPMDATTPLPSRTASFAPNPVDKVITIPPLPSGSSSSPTDEVLMNEIAGVLGYDDDDGYDDDKTATSLSFMARVKDVLHTLIDRSLLETPDSLHLIQELLTFASATRLGALPLNAAPSFSLADNMPPEGIDFEQRQAPSSVPSSASRPPPTSSSPAATNYLYNKGPYSKGDETDADEGEDEDWCVDNSERSDNNRSGNKNPRKKRVTATVPRINDALVLDGGGNFVAEGPSDTNRFGINRLHSQASSTSFATEKSFSREDSIMDRRKKVSYVAISTGEKRDVFKLAAVRRSMRHLNYANILMSDEVLMLANKYMEVGPSRASLMHIGYDSVRINCPEKTFMDEVKYISPWMYRLVCLRGYNVYFWGLALVFLVCDLAFFVVHVARTQTVDIVTGPVMFTIVLFAIFNQVHSFTTALNKDPLCKDVPIEHIHLTGVSYLRLKGLEVLAKAQHRVAAEKKRKIAPESDLALFKAQLIHSTLVETFVFHGLLAISVALWTGISTIIGAHARGDTVVWLLAIGSMFNKMIMGVVIMHIGFCVRLAQKLSEFEVRRTEADIR